MATTGTYAPRGLYTNSNPYSEVPPGALATAENVVHRTRGLLEPRFGYQPVAAADDVEELIPYDDDLAMVTNESPFWDIEWESDGSVATGSMTFDPERIFSGQARGNLYLNALEDVFKVTGSQTTSAVSAGIEGPVLIEWLSDAAGDGLDANKDIRVAATLERTDANELIVTSPPSSSFIFQNDTGASVTPTYRVFLPPNALAGDIMRLFKSEEVATDAVPSPQMILTQEAELTSTDISNVYIDIIDDLASVDRIGNPTIYTAPSRGGITNANDRPPVCKDIAQFKGSLFFANTRQPHQMVLGWNAESAGLTGLTDGIGGRTIIGTAAVGNPTMTAVVDTTGLQEGMFYISGTARWAAGALIVSTTVNTITFDANAVSSGGESGIGLDSIEIDGITYAAGTPATFIRAVNSGTDEFGNVLNTNSGVPDPNVFVATLTATKNGTSGASTASELVKVKLERITGVDTSFEVFATHGDEYTPIVPLPGAGSGLDSTADTRPNGIYWSKNLQPEHVPLLNFQEIGDGTEIQRIIPARDALWIFKKDGIYRLTGNGAGTTADDADWRVDPFDSTRFLAAVKSPAVLDDVVYAWTNRGVVSLTDAGPVNISQDTIQDAIAEDQDFAISDFNSTEQSQFGFANEAHNEYWLRTTRGSALFTINVFNTHTNAWTTQELPVPVKAGTYRPDKTQNVFREFATLTFDVWHEKVFRSLNGNVHPHGDEEFGFTATIAAGGTDFTITANPLSYVPSVGDCMFIFGSSNRPYITVVDSPTEFTVSPPSEETGAGELVVATGPVNHTIEYQWHSQGNPGLSKNFYLVTWAFALMKDVPSIAYDFTTPLSDTPTTQTRLIDLATAPEGPMELRAYVDIDHARTTQIKPRIQISGACGEWQHAGVQYITNDVGEKVAER